MLSRLLVSSPESLQDRDKCRTDIDLSVLILRCGNFWVPIKWFEIRANISYALNYITGIETDTTIECVIVFTTGIKVLS